MRVILEHSLALVLRDLGDLVIWISWEACQLCILELFPASPIISARHLHFWHCIGIAFFPSITCIFVSTSSVGAWRDDWDHHDFSFPLRLVELRLVIRRLDPNFSFYHNKVHAQRRLSTPQSLVRPFTILIHLDKCLTYFDSRSHARKG
jgi:hypothetical protein